MARTLMLVFVAICWAGVALDAIVHLASGDVLVPAGVLAAFGLWLTLWRRHYGKSVAAQPVSV